MPEIGEEKVLKNGAVGRWMMVGDKKVFRLVKGASAGHKASAEPKTKVVKSKETPTGAQIGSSLDTELPVKPEKRKRQPKMQKVLAAEVIKAQTS